MAGNSAAYKTLDVGPARTSSLRGDVELASIAQSQLVLLSGLLRTLITLVRVRMRPQRLMQLCGDIEALARRNTWTASADLIRSMQFFFSEIRDADRYGELPATIAPAIQAAATRPQEDWFPIVMATRIAVGTEIERQRGSRN